VLSYREALQLKWRNFFEKTHNPSFKLTMLKILLTGITGQLGSELENILSKEWKMIPVSRKEMDLSNESTIRSIIRDKKPDLIINPAAYTEVDRAENEKRLAFAINEKAPRIIAEEAKALHIPLIHFSTDFVFDGKKSTPYLETDRPSPKSVYGLSKLEGEKAIQEVDGDYLIFRTAWVYSRKGNNFRNTIRRLAKKHPELNIINDQVGSPTTTTYISLVLKKVIELLYREKEIPFEDFKGIYHLTCGGICSWYDFAEVIIKDLFQHEVGHCTLNPIGTKDYPTAATRPQYSVLNNQKLKQIFGLEQKQWHDCFQEMG
jgi:dTDP-4-dehydrorhamnose reductase